jgi:hypothetical protein
MASKPNICHFAGPFPQLTAVIFAPDPSETNQWRHLNRWFAGLEIYFDFSASIPQPFASSRMKVNMKSIITEYPDFQTLPKGIKKMLVITEEHFFADARPETAAVMSLQPGRNYWIRPNVTTAQIFHMSIITG